MSPEIYLDSNATTAVLPAAADAAARVMRASYANPSSTHSAGLVARRLVDAVRAQARALVGAGSGKLLFVSGATEGIQTAVLSALHAVSQQRAQGQATGRLLVCGATEHKAVSQSLAHWNTVLGLNLEIRTLPVDGNGHHDLDLLAQWAPETALLCTMAANNETGVISDLAGIEKVLMQRDSPALWLADCVQALGKLPLQLSSTRIDYAPFSGHKLYAPKGIGLLYVRDGAPFTPLQVGGGQEGDGRAGTENMAGIAALGAVFTALQDGQTFCNHAQMLSMRERLAASLQRAFPGLVFNAPLAGTLPTTLNFSVPGVPSALLLDLLDAAGVRASGGSACSAAKAAPSAVLAAMGLPEWQSTSAVRMSFGALDDDAFIDRACEAIEASGRALQACATASTAAMKGATAAAATDKATTAAPTTACEAGEMDWADLDAFLRGHPQTRLVDVRDCHEHRADRDPLAADRPADNVPLPQIACATGDWLAQPQRPVVFFCRSGARSAQAAALLADLGHPQALHLTGGLAARLALALSADHP